MIAKHLVFLALSLCLAAGGLAAGLHVGAFSEGRLDAWEEESFVGQTEYALVEENGQKVLEAQCEASASGLFRRQSVDLRETPVLEWSWRVNGVFEGIDETTREGDDYPARIYVVQEHRILRWRTRAMNYVWASEKPRHADWPNAYASQARMLALRSGDAEAGEWKTERRNIVEDFKRYHGREIDSIDAIALMTDCDDTGRSVRAWYGDIRFVSDGD